MEKITNQFRFPDNLLRDLKDPVASPLTQDQMDGLLFALSALDERRRMVLTMRYIRGMTAAAIGKELGGISRARVGQIIEDSLESLIEAGVVGYLRRGLSAKMKSRQAEISKEIKKGSRLLNRPIEDVGASNALIKCLKRNGITTGKQLINVIDSKEWEESSVKGLGKGKILEICRILASYIR